MASNTLPLFFRQARQSLESLSSALKNDFQNVPAIIADVDRFLNECSNSIVLEINMAKRRILKDEFNNLQIEFNSLKALHEQEKMRRLHEKQKQELIPTYAEASPHQRHVHIDINTLVEQQKGQLNASSNNLDGYLNMGINTLEELKKQKSILKGIHKNVLDGMNKLGLSQSIIKIIEMRTTQDKYIFWIGLTVTVGCMYWFYSYWTTPARAM